MPNDLSKRGSPERNKIAMHKEREVHYWSKHLRIRREEFQARSGQGRQFGYRR